MNPPFLPADFIYPLRVEQDALYRLLTRVIGPRVGRTHETSQLVAAINALERAERHARALTPFDPSGL